MNKVATKSNAQINNSNSNSNNINSFEMKAEVAALTSTLLTLQKSLEISHSNNEKLRLELSEQNDRHKIEIVSNHFISFYCILLQIISFNQFNNIYTLSSSQG